jgi:hypothetical protein
MGFKRYVGVDLFLNFSKNENVTKELGFPAIEIQPGYELRVNADMLLFLQKMPDSCCSIAIDGIDRFVIQMEKYHAAVAEQIMRVVQPGGVVFGTNSRALDYLRGKHKAGALSMFHDCMPNSKETMFMVRRCKS